MSYVYRKRSIMSYLFFKRAFLGKQD